MRDLIEQSSEDSFPASDPPSWNPLHIGPPIQEISGHGPGREAKDEPGLKKEKEKRKKDDDQTQTGL
jgi:hypothetical protein